MQSPDAGEADRRGQLRPPTSVDGFTVSDTPARRRIGVKVGRKILFIDPRRIIAVHAKGSYVSLRLGSVSYLVREPISQIAEKLQCYGFIRIHRSSLVNTAFVEEVRPYLTGEYVVCVEGGKEYTVTRTYKKNLSSLAALWIGGPAFVSTE